MSLENYTNALKRVFENAGCTTQVELAEFLEIRQSSISDAKRRRSIPADWQLKLLRKRLINPDWLLTGEGAKYLQAVELGKGGKPHVVYITEVKPPEQCSAQDLVNELVRRALRDTHIDKESY